MIVKEVLKLNSNWSCIVDENSKLKIEDIGKFSNIKLDEMKVPSNWELEGLHNYSGVVWFIKYFSVSQKEIIKNLKILEFNGVDYNADVWLNDEYLGTHEGYFQKFFFDVSEKIKSENRIVVKVNSPKEDVEKHWPLKKQLIKGIFNHHDCRPGGWSKVHGQDRNTGGIWNDVQIIFSNKAYIENLKVRPQINYEKNSALLLVELNLFFQKNYLFANEELVKIKITNPSGKILYKNFKINFPTLSENFSFAFEINDIALWWTWDLGKQNLYTITIESELFPTYETVFGIREVYLDDEENFYLNKKRLFLRGTNIIPEQFLSSLTEKRIQRQVALMREANINAVRIHAHVNRDEYYSELDKAGILVWQDFALQWTYDESEEFLINAVGQIKEMVRGLYNHPSIAFWCCHNEPGEQVKKLDSYLYDAVLSEDNSRVVRKASNYEEHAYDGWYWGNKEHYAATPMGPLVTEFGAQALPILSTLKKIFPNDNLNKPDWEKWKYHNFQYEQTFNVAKIEMGKSIQDFVKNSQQYQSDLLHTAINFYRREKSNRINGIFQFMFIDCWDSITWSVVDYHENPKLGYHTLKKVYQPLFVSINLRQEIYGDDVPLQIDIWIINDLHIEFKKCKLIFRINGTQFGEIFINNIAPDAVKFIRYEEIKIPFPKETKNGLHQIDVELYDSKEEIISTNDFKIELRKRIKG